MDERIDAPSGGRITDELREWAEGDTLRAGMSLRTARDQVLAIAERIDAEHERQLEVLYRDMSDAEYVELPKDADGEPIHVGDELRDEWHEQNQGEVEWLMLDHYGWWLMLKNSCERFYIHEFHEWRHHHAPTVEETLREFAEKWLHTAEGTEREDAVVAEYAKRLRLAGDVE